MGKKPFGWVRDAEESVVPSPYRPTNNERSEATREADEAVDRMMELHPGARTKLPLDEEVEREFRILDNIKLHHRSARARQADLVRKMLRARDLSELLAALGGEDEKVAAFEAKLEELVRWRARILEEGDTALQAFMEAYPEADRQHLRSLASRVRKSGRGTAPARRASKGMMAAIRKAAGV